MLISCYMLMSSVFFATRKCQKIQTIDENSIEEENLHICWTCWGISMKFSGKMSLIIILKLTKNQHSNRSLKSTFLEKPQGGQIDPQTI